MDRCLNVQDQFGLDRLSDPGTMRHRQIMRELHPGIVDRQIDRPVGGLDFGDHARDRGRGRQVEHQVVDSTAFRRA